MIEGVEVVIRQPGHPDRVVRLQEGSVRVGRAEDNEIVLSDVGVSRRHALITVSGSGVQIEDLGSGNGTYYHGYRVKVQDLSDSDEIVVDPFVLRFRIRGDLGRPRGLDGGESRTTARLDVVVGQGMAGSSYPLPPQGLTIGRSEDRDVVIPDPAASRHHVSIYVDANQYTLKDMGSANGVFVNAVRVRECLLADGDLIRIGNTELRFVLYDDRSVESTTQLMTSGIEDFGDSRSLPAPGAKRGRGSWLALALAFFMAASAVLLVILVLGILAFLQVNGDLGGGSRAQIPQTPPSWRLTLPDGLPAATTDVLFNEGTGAMRSGDNRLALQNFYRILEADNANPYAKRFAFAAGEQMVVDALEHQFSGREQIIAERDALLARVAQGGRRGRDARSQLLKEFADDPTVQKQLDLPKNEAQKALDTLVTEAEASSTAGKHAEVVEKLERVVIETKDENQRAAAQKSLSAARLALARETHDVWASAVMADAVGEPSEDYWKELSALDPKNISARVHSQAD